MTRILLTEKSVTEDDKSLSSLWGKNKKIFWPLMKAQPHLLFSVFFFCTASLWFM